MSSVPKSFWDAASDRDLLFSILEVSEVKGIKFNDVADKMKEKGYTFTKEGCRQHFQKMRKTARSTDTDDENADDSPSVTKKSKAAKTTPVKPRTPKTSSEPRTPKATKGKKVTATGSPSFGADDDDADMDQGDRKRKRVKKEHANRNQVPAFKFESTDGAPVDLENDDLYEEEA